MAAFLCRILDTDERPVPGICVTVTSSQSPQLVAFSDFDGFASIWFSFTNSVPQQDSEGNPHCTPTVSLAKIAFNTNRPSLPRALACVSLDPTRQTCIILRLLENGFRLQSTSLPLPSEVSPDPKQEHNISDMPLLYGSEEAGLGERGTEYR